MRIANELRRLADEIEGVSGVFTISFHPDVIHPARCPGWFELYVRFLEEMKRRNAWFGTVKDVGEHWLKSLQ